MMWNYVLRSWWTSLRSALFYFSSFQSGVLNQSSFELNEKMLRIMWRIYITFRCICVVLVYINMQFSFGYASIFTYTTVACEIMASTEQYYFILFSLDSENISIGQDRIGNSMDIRSAMWFLFQLNKIPIHYENQNGFDQTTRTSEQQSIFAVRSIDMLSSKNCGWYCSDIHFRLCCSQ